MKKNMFARAMRYAQRHLVGWRLKRVERRLAEQLSDPEEYPVVFIVGAPRSGSTLLYESIVTALDVGYFSNLHHVYYQTPSAVEKVYGHTMRNRQGIFKSHYGTIDGAESPSECWQFWYRFFPRVPHHIRQDDVERSVLDDIRNEFAKLASVSKRPWIVKNLPCGMRIEAIRAALPQARFIFIRRDLVDNAVSILRARRNAGVAPNQWWSVQPPNVDSLLELSPNAQVVHQVQSIGAEIDRCRKDSPREHFLEVSYEDFCRDPHRQIDRIAEFIRLQDQTVAQRNELPNSFPIAKYDNEIDHQEISELVNRIRQSEGHA